MRDRRFVYLQFGVLAQLLMLFASISRAQGTAAQAATTQRVSLAAERLLSAIEIRDDTASLTMTMEYRLQTDRLKRDNPKVLWEKVITAYTTKMKAAGPAGNTLRSVNYLLEFAHDRETSEVRENVNRIETENSFPDERKSDITYFVMNFPDVQHAPLIDDKLLHKCVLGVSFDHEYGLFAAASRVPAGDEFYTDPPLLIVGGTWGGIGDPVHGGVSGILRLNILGGKPPFTSRVDLGGKISKRQIHDAPDQMVQATDDTAAPMTGPSDCTAALTDSAGCTAAVRFSLPDANGLYEFVTKPFGDNGDSSHKREMTAIESGAVGAGDTAPAIPSVTIASMGNLQVAFDELSGIRFKYPNGWQSAGVVKPPIRSNLYDHAKTDSRILNSFVFIAEDHGPSPSLEKFINIRRDEFSRSSKDAQLSKTVGLKIAKIPCLSFESTQTIQGHLMHGKVIGLLYQGKYIEIRMGADAPDFDRWMEITQPVIDSFELVR